MDSAPSDQQQSPAECQPSSRRRQWGLFVLGLLVVYIAVAYLIAPEAWWRYARSHPALDDVPGITETAAGIPGDPINVALIGTETELKTIMIRAKWYPADPLTLRSCLEIADAVVLKKPYADAPVSNLYLWGHKENLAFEQAVGKDPRRRHHVRFWRSAKLDANGRPVWAGSAVFDERVGLSHTTGQITHVTAPDVDVERDYLFRQLNETGDLSDAYPIDDFHEILHGRNGGGDPWYTDGRLFVGVIAIK
jgi:hypothetical protein